MLRSIIWYCSFTVSLLFKIPPMFKARRLPEERRDPYVQQVVSKWAKARFKLSGSSIEVIGAEHIPADACLFVSNHQSNFDIAVILGYIDRLIGFIAKKETEKIPFVSHWMTYIYCIFLDRQDTGKSLQAILDGIKLLKSGKSLWIFPEGTRSKSNKTGEFKEGSTVMALKARVPIVPVTIIDTYKIMEANGNRIKPAQVKLIIHPPIETAGLDKAEKDTLGAKVKAIIEQPLLHKDS